MGLISRSREAGFSRNDWFLNLGCWNCSFHYWCWHRNLLRKGIFSNLNQYYYHLMEARSSQYLEYRDLKGRYRKVTNRCSHIRFSLNWSFNSSFFRCPIAHIPRSRNSKTIKQIHSAYIHSVSRLEFLMSLFKSRAIPHKWLLNSCPRQKYSWRLLLLMLLLICVFIQIWIEFLKVERFNLGGSGRDSTIWNYSHHSTIILCSWVGKLCNLRIKLWDKIRRLFISAMTPDLLSIVSAAYRMVARVQT